jgi:hypothetical protein
LDTIMVNGPEDDVLDWDAVDWRAVEDDVRRLRQRIFTASRAGDLVRPGKSGGRYVCELLLILANSSAL